MNYWQWLFNLLNVKKWDNVSKGITIMIVGTALSGFFSVVIFDKFGLLWFCVWLLGFLFSLSYGFYVMDVKE